MIEIALSILAALLIAVLGAGTQRVREWLSRHRRLGHLFALAGHADRVQIVIPSFPVDRFHAGDGTAHIPPNVPVMPMAEGGAIARLVSGLNEIGQCNIELVSQGDYKDDFDVTFSIGGPSVNRVSGRLLAEHFPDFVLRYPEHVAAYGTTTFLPHRKADGALSEDYGFIAVGDSDNGHRFVVLCGVWAPGTDIATATLLALNRKSQVAWMLRAGQAFFAVAHGNINELEITGSHVIEVRRDTR